MTLGENEIVRVGSALLCCCVGNEDEMNRLLDNTVSRETNHRSVCRKRRVERSEASAPGRCKFCKMTLDEIGVGVDLRCEARNRESSRKLLRLNRQTPIHKDERRPVLPILDSSERIIRNC